MEAFDYYFTPEYFFDNKYYFGCDEVVEDDVEVIEDDYSEEDNDVEVIEDDYSEEVKVIEDDYSDEVEVIEEDEEEFNVKNIIIESDLKIFSNIDRNIQLPLIHSFIT